MQPLSPPTAKGCTVVLDDFHHKTADQPRRQAKATAKRLKHTKLEHERKTICGVLS